MNVKEENAIIKQHTKDRCPNVYSVTMSEGKVLMEKGSYHWVEYFEENEAQYQGKLQTLPRMSPSQSQMKVSEGNLKL